MRLLEGCSILYTGSTFRAFVIRAKLVYLSITSKQARVALECCHAIRGRDGGVPLQPQLMRCALIFCCMYGCVFQED